MPVIAFERAPVFQHETAIGLDALDCDEFTVGNAPPVAGLRVGLELEPVSGCERHFPFAANRDAIQLPRRNCRCVSRGFDDQAFVGDGDELR